MTKPKGPPRQKANYSLARETVQKIKDLAEYLEIPQSEVVDRAVENYQPDAIIVVRGEGK